MRRILSILMLLVLALGPTVPAGAQSLRSGWTGKVDESRIPACCRRNGKHHCDMGAEAAETQPIGFGHETTVGAGESCPCMPHALVSTAPSVLALGHAVASLMCTTSARHSLQEMAAAARMSDRRSWPQRGPPALQLL